MAEPQSDEAMRRLEKVQRAQRRRAAIVFALLVLALVAAFAFSLRH